MAKKVAERNYFLNNDFEQVSEDAATLVRRLTIFDDGSYNTKYTALVKKKKAVSKAREETTTVLPIDIEDQLPIIPDGVEVIELPKELEKSVFSLLGRALQVFRGSVGKWVTTRAGRKVFIAKESIKVDTSVSRLIDGTLQTERGLGKLQRRVVGLFLRGFGKDGNRILRPIPRFRRAELTGVKVGAALKSSAAEARVLKLEAGLKNLPEEIIDTTVAKLIPNNRLVQNIKRAESPLFPLNLPRTSPPPFRDPVTAAAQFVDFNHPGKFFIRDSVARLFGGNIWMNGNKINPTGLTRRLQLNRWKALRFDIDFRGTSMGRNVNLTAVQEYFDARMRVQYALTQKVLLNNNINNVTLFRGLRIANQNTRKQFSTGSTQDVSFGTLSSFTTNKEMAEAFGNVVFEVQVPRSLVFGNWQTGLGAGGIFREWLVLGNEIKLLSKVIKNVEEIPDLTRIF